ncbi:MAG: hypothetical protein ACK5Z3_01105 [Pseudanabaena sp.]
MIALSKKYSAIALDKGICDRADRLITICLCGGTHPERNRR